MQCESVVSSPHQEHAGNREQDFPSQIALMKTRLLNRSRATQLEEEAMLSHMMICVTVIRHKSFNVKCLSKLDNIDYIDSRSSWGRSSWEQLHEQTKEKQHEELLPWGLNAPWGVGAFVSLAARQLS